VMAESPRERAARMPHRRGLGEKAVDAAAECELGRMLLRNEISEPQNTAGEVYVRIWRGYVSTLNAPHSQEKRQRVSPVGVPPGRSNLPVDLAGGFTQAVRMGDRRWTSNGNRHGRCGWYWGLPCPWCTPLLRLGLNRLAEHYGLTNYRR
jgi:hypothetical protein